jgi:hypothetical protein
MSNETCLYSEQQTFWIAGSLCVLYPFQSNTKNCHWTQMITFHPIFSSESRNKFSFRYGAQYLFTIPVLGKVQQPQLCHITHNLNAWHCTNTKHKTIPEWKIIKNNCFKIHDLYKDIPNLLKYHYYPKKKFVSYQAYWLLQSLPDQSVQLFACLHNSEMYPNHEMSPPLQRPCLDLYHSYNKMQTENTATCCHLNFITYFQNYSYKETN